MNHDITNAFFSSGEQWAMKNYKWSVPKNKQALKASLKNSSSSKIVIFLVEDDPVFIKALAHSLSDIKWHQQIEIKIFSTGEECIANLAFKPSIIILDFYLDSKYYDAMNGIKVLKKIKQTYPAAKVIILSGQSNVDVALDMIKYKAYDYVPKNENAFLRVRNIVEHIISDIQINTSIKNENKRYGLINTLIMGLLVIILLFSILINQYF